MNLVFTEARFPCPVAENHVLKLAFAALVADRTVEWMVRQEKLERALASFLHLLGVGPNHHAFGYGQSTSNLQLGRFLHFDETHTASRLQSQAVVVTKSRNGNAGFFGRVDQQRAGHGLHGLAVDRKIHKISHRVS